MSRHDLNDEQWAVIEALIRKKSSKRGRPRNDDRRTLNGNGLPIGLHVNSAQPHEITLAEPTLQTISVPRKRGRPRTRPQELVADKAYDSADFRRKLRRRGIKPTIPTFERRKRKLPTLESRAVFWVDGQLPSFGRAL